MLEKQSISNEVKTEIIQDSKLLYICKTLSRTKLKDYENYVINAVWNRVNECIKNDSDLKDLQYDLKPISQQFIRKSNNERYFVDLYFPQLNIGIECNEPHHEWIKERDKKRMDDITNILKGVDVDSVYDEKQIFVYNAIDEKDGKIISTKLFDEIEQEINKVVEDIIEKIKDIKKNGKWKNWKIYNEPIDYFKEKEKKVISVYDDIGFRTIADATNCVLGTNYENLGWCWAAFCSEAKRTIQKFVNKEQTYNIFERELPNDKIKNYSFWFPKHSKIVKDADKTEVYKTSYSSEESKQYINVWSNDGKIILTENKKAQKEYQVENIKKFLDKTSDNKTNLKFESDKKVITFIRIDDFVLGTQYKFAGIFGFVEDPEWELRVRVAEEFPILNPEINK